MTWKFRDLLSVLGSWLGVQGGAPQTFGTLRRKQVLSGEKKGIGDPTDHSSSDTGTPEPQSPVSPDDPPCGHRTIWETGGDAGTELPREAPWRSRRAQRQDISVWGTCCQPSPHAVCWRELRSKRRLPGTEARRLGTGWREDQLPQAVLTGPFLVPILGPPVPHTHHFWVS